MSNHEEFHHALYIDHDKCIRCTHCVKECPTEAIRIVNSKVEIREERCIDCGECMRVCPQQAIDIEHDDLEQIKNYKYKVALFPAVFLGQFPDRITEDQVYASLIQLGFTHALEVEQPIGVLQNIMKNELKNNKSGIPLISSFCPAVARLIQIKYPSLTDQILPMKAPHDLVASFAIEQFKQQGIEREEIGLFYVTPCVAKISAVKAPVIEESSLIDGVINSKDLYNKVMHIADDVEPLENKAFRNQLTKEGVQWSLTHGECWWMKKKTIAVDGIHNVMKFLERLENEEVFDVDFLELRACDRSCPAGVLMTQNRFLTVERLKKRAKKYPSAEKRMMTKGSCEFESLEAEVVAKPVQPRPMLRFGDDMARAMARMTRARSIMCHLPGIDCGACGAPTCMALSEDMVNGRARMSDCIFIQQLWQKDNKIDPKRAFERMEEKWGKGRFDPDCTKIGAKNEGY